MPQQQITVSAFIEAPAERIYAILADYHEGHPHILPRPYFSDLEVEAGGVGEGTRIRFQMHVMGVTRMLRAEITEPEPGRVLVETLDTGAVTTFTVRPDEEGTQVTFSTTLPVRGGVAGWVERLLTPMLLRRIYTRELVLLADRARASIPA